LFDGNDVAVKGKISGGDADSSECNISTQEEPKFIKFSSSLTPEQMAEYT
jgi:hypothetical protein